LNQTKKSKVQTHQMEIVSSSPPPFKQPMATYISLCVGLCPPPLGHFPLCSCSDFGLDCTITQSKSDKHPNPSNGNCLILDTHSSIQWPPMTIGSVMPSCHGGREAPTYGPPTLYRSVTLKGMPTHNTITFEYVCFKAYRLLKLTKIIIWQIIHFGSIGTMCI